MCFYDLGRCFGGSEEATDLWIRAAMLDIVNRVGGQCLYGLLHCLLVEARAGFGVLFADGKRFRQG